MSNVLTRLKAGTVALLRGGTVAELGLPTEAAVEAVIEAVAEGHGGIEVEAAAETGKPMEKDKEGYTPGETDPDEDDQDEDEAPKAEASTDPVAAAVAGERGRWMAVLSSPEATGRVELAQDLLATTDLEASKIISSLKKAPQAQQQSVSAMLGHDNPNLGAGGDAGGDDKARIAAGWDKAIASLTPPGFSPLSK